MKHFIFVNVLLASIFFQNLAMASPAGDALGGCMTDSLTGRERKQLAQWIFFAMAAHPDIREFSRVTPEAHAANNEQVGKLVTRLLTENCVAYVKLAVKEDGQAAIVGAFELVGRVAMQELMANKEVTATISAYAKFVDQEKLGAVLKAK